jgi:hypothetical protein
MSTRRREGSLRTGPNLRSDDQALDGLSLEEIFRFVNGHARTHGSFSGLPDFLEQFDRTIRLARTQGALAKEFADSLAADAAKILAALERGNRTELDAIYLGVCAGFLFANLKREVDQSNKPARGGSITKAGFLAARADLGPEATKADVAHMMGVTWHGLDKWLKKNMPDEVWM